MQRIISWNVASVRSRLGALEKLLKQEDPEVVFLQEIKATEENFPSLFFQSLGYQSYICGQKSYNGVAILSKKPLTEVSCSLPNAPQSEPFQARFIQARLPQGTQAICVYVPNGTAPMNDPTDTSRLTFKIKWLDALTHHLQHLKNQGENILLGGDFNVIERNSDVYNPQAFLDSALMLPEVRQAFERLNQVGLKNMIRLFYPAEKTYTFWDFQMGAWPRNLGILLDFFFVSPALVEQVAAAKIYKEVRGWEKTSDHAPIGLELKD